MPINAEYRGPGELPEIIPVFPLPGALLLPRGQMPLNIFEPRYLAMVDDALRDGPFALKLVEPIARANPGDPSILSTLAAARAESGRFSEAISPAERALALVRTSGDVEATALLQRRLDSYRSHRPWRQ